MDLKNWTFVFDNTKEPYNVFTENIPKIIGEISFDENCKKTLDDSQKAELLKEFPKIPTDLNKGFKDWKEQQLVVPYENFNQILQVSHECEKNGSEKIANIYIWRGMITKLMMVLAGSGRFDNSDFRLLIQKYQGNSLIISKWKQPDVHDRFEYYGRSFENMMTRKINISDLSENQTEKKSSISGYCPIFSREDICSKAKIFYAAEIDAYVRGDWDVLKDNEAVELKVSSIHQRNRLHPNKTAQWWTQSVLVGIKHLIVGWRNDHGFLQKCEIIPIEILKPRKYLEMCAFVSQLFDWLVEKIVDDSSISDGTLFELELAQPAGRIIVRQSTTDYDITKYPEPA